tara:strand:+ start:360 stop:530 length:171 start_codon:yes stop_codon:yes gene_type:complete
MAICSTIEVTDLKSGKSVIINEADFNDKLYRRGAKKTVAESIKETVPRFVKKRKPR